MQNIEIIRCGLNERDELFTVLNQSFSVARKQTVRFQTMLPRIARHTEEMMNKHFALRVDGKMVAALGVYPLPVVIDGEKFMFSTVGNIGTLYEHTGKGYMSLLLDEAMRELDRIKADASRLGGKRERYNRYRYEVCGTGYLYCLNQLMNPADHGITFRQIKRTDVDWLHFAMKLHEKKPCYAERMTMDDFYDAYVAFESKPYISLGDDGQPVGTFTYNNEIDAITEIDAVSLERFIHILNALHTNKPLNVLMTTGRENENRYLKSVCATYEVRSPSMFYIRNFAGITNALLRWKGKLTKLPDFHEVIKIEDYGCIELTTENGKGSCVQTDAPATKNMTWLEAEQYLFGVVKQPETTENVLPLPLSWYYQDRV